MAQLEDLHTAMGWDNIVPSDTANLPQVPRAIHVGVGGNVVMVDRDGRTCTFQNVASGQMLVCAPVQIRSSGTTASGLVALF